MASSSPGGSETSARSLPSKLSDPPTVGGSDAVYAAASAAISAIPIAGGPALELIQAVFGPPLDKRRQAWFNELADAIRSLQTNDIPVDSDEFVTAVARASQVALGTHVAEKIAMLKAAIIHAAMPDRPADIVTTRFLRFIEDLDPEHFVMLTFLRDPGGHFDRQGIPKPDIMMGGTNSVFAHARIAISHIEIVLADLGDRRLADSGSWNTIMTSNGAWAPRTTALGNQLLDFVSTVDLAQPI